MYTNEVFKSDIKLVNDAAAIDVRQVATLGLEIKGTWSGVLSFEYSIDGQVWHALGSVSGVTQSTGNGAFVFDTAPYKLVRIRFSTATSGNPRVYLFGKEEPMSPANSMEVNISEGIFSQKVTTSGSITYIGIAPAGTLQATAAWQAKKIDATDPNNIVTTWADGGNFSQVATDLTALTYA